MIEVGAVIACVILAHLVGDYIIQNQWMADNKQARWWPAIVHGITYTIPFLLITRSWLALLVVTGTHVLIDHWRLAKHLSWLTNQLAPRASRPSWEDSKATGFPPHVPVWMAVWLMIITDNTLHILIGVGAVLWL